MDLSMYIYRNNKYPIKHGNFYFNQNCIQCTKGNTKHFLKQYIEIYYIYGGSIQMVEKTQWAGFKGRLWKEEINVRDFIQNNYTPYDGDESFLAGPTEATNKLWG